MKAERSEGTPLRTRSAVEDSVDEEDEDEDDEEEEEEASVSSN
jgi:hypothetical protein